MRKALCEKILAKLSEQGPDEIMFLTGRGCGTVATELAQMVGHVNYSCAFTLDNSTYPARALRQLRHFLERCSRCIQVFLICDISEGLHKPTMWIRHLQLLKSSTMYKLRLCVFVKSAKSCQKKWGKGSVVYLI